MTQDVLPQEKLEVAALLLEPPTFDESTQSSIEFTEKYSLFKKLVAVPVYANSSRKQIGQVNANKNMKQKKLRKTISSRNYYFYDKRAGDNSLNALLSQKQQQRLSIANDTLTATEQEVNNNNQVATSTGAIPKARGNTVKASNTKSNTLTIDDIDRSKTYKRERETIDSNLRNGMEVEIADWQENENSCECVTNSENNDNNKTASNEQPVHDNAKVPNLAIVENVKGVKSNDRDGLLRFTSHSTDVNYNVPEFVTNTNKKKVIDRRSKAFESHLLRHSGARAKNSRDFTSLNESFTSSKHSLNSSKGSLTSSRESLISSAYSRLPPILKVGETSKSPNLGSRPLTPISPFTSFTPPVKTKDINGPKNSKLLRTKELIIINKESELTINEYRKSSFTIEDNIAEETESLAGTPGRSEENIAEDTESLAGTPGRGKDDYEEQQLHVEKLTIKDMIEEREREDKEALRDQKRRRQNILDEEEEDISKNSIKQLPKKIQEMINNLTRSIILGVFDTIKRVYTLKIKKERDKKELMQVIYNHDINLIGNNIVDSLLDRVSEENK